MTKNTILLLVITLLCSTTRAQLSQWEFGGYAKDLITYADGDYSLLPEEFENFQNFEIGRLQNTAQLRLNLFWYPADGLTFTAQARSLLIYQKNIKLSQMFLGSLTTDSYYFDLKAEWNEENDWFASSEIDRLYLDWIYKDSEVILGRQRIAWGTCLVWNPTDFFNPYDILDFDYEERAGTDAAHIQYYTGPLSQFNIAVTPGRTKNDVIYAGRYVMNQSNYDVALIAGWYRNSLKLAGNWAGEIWDGGFRGEVLYTDPDIRYTTFNLQPEDLTDLFSEKHIQTPYWTIALSYDYTFGNSFYTHTEYIYNGLGTTENAGYRRYDILFTGELTPARHSVFQEFAYQISSLLRGSFFIIYNPTDYSWIGAPSIQYSLANNWELFLMAFPSGGESGTEYGGFPTQYFARAKYSF